MKPQRIRRVVAAVLSALVSFVGVSALGLQRSAVAGSADPVAIGIVAYFADVAANRAAITSRAGVGIVVMNTLQAAGAGAAVGDYKGAGKRVFGYFAAGYAPSGANGITPKSLAQLQATASAMFSAYPSIDGLFLDEVLNNDSVGCAAPAAFYVSFYQWLQTAYPGKSLILNPGTALCSAFAGAADIFLVYENRLSFYRSAFAPYFAQPNFDWLRALPNSRVWSIVYGVPVSEMGSLLDELADYAGIVTVLSDNADHPYSNVPPAAELDLMNARATGVVLPVTTTTTTIGISTGSSGGSSGPAIVPPAATTTTIAPSTIATTSTVPEPNTTVAVATTTTIPASTTPPATATTIAAPAVLVQPVITTRPRAKQPTRLVSQSVVRCRTSVTVKGKAKKVCRRVRALVRIAV